MLNREKSAGLFRESLSVIPGGVNSPVRAFSGMDMTPLIVEKGQGDTIWDVDGNAYIDYCGSWGVLILGHAPERVVRATTERLRSGLSFGIATEIETRLAQEIIKHIPSIEKIRFVSSGTEATMSALRLARGVTGRSLVIKFHGNYHGHVDSLLVHAGSGVTRLNPTSSSKGIPKEMVQHTVSLPYNNIEVCRSFIQNSQDLAAVLIEPIAGNMGLVPATGAFLQMLREETEKKGALLIFDEVISGFRVSLQGAQGIYGITPDLTCLGKIVGGGFPAAAFGGKRAIMDELAPLGEVYQAGTLSGNPVAMQAGLETLKAISEPGFYEELQQKTDRLLVPIEAWIQEHAISVCVNRVGSMFTLFFGVKHVTNQAEAKQVDEAMFRRYFLSLFKQGIYVPPSAYETSFVSSTHTEANLDKTRQTMLNFLESESGVPSR